MSSEHADLGQGVTHHGTPDECGCWSRLVAKLIRDLAEARALAEKFLGERVPRSDVTRARREGAEAMRAEAIECCYQHYSIDGTAQKIEAEIRALPLPGDDK